MGSHLSGEAPGRKDLSHSPSLPEHPHGAKPFVAAETWGIAPIGRWMETRGMQMLRVGPLGFLVRLSRRQTQPLEGKRSTKESPGPSD